MVKKFTFRKDKPPTGLYAVGHGNPNTNIKLDKKVVGYIKGPSWQTKDHKWSVGLTVKKTAEEMIEEPTCKWRWAFFKQRFETEPEAREWLQRNAEFFQSKYDIWNLEDE